MFFSKKKHKKAVSNAHAEILEHSGALLIKLAQMDAMEQRKMAMAAGRRNSAAIIMNTGASSSTATSKAEMASKLCIQGDKFFFGHGVPESKSEAFELVSFTFLVVLMCVCRMY